jgi:hypothetical protein
MKLKKVLGFGLAFVAMSMLTVAVQAATYTAKATVASDKKTVTVAVNLTDADAVNGYAVKLGYDPAVLTPVAKGTDATGDACYATSSLSDGGVLVADLTDADKDDTNDTVAIGWAAADAVKVDSTNGTDVAVVTFEVVEQKSTDVTVEVVASAKDANTLETSTTGAKGTVSFGILGDVDGDGDVTTYDGVLIYQHVLELSKLADEQLSRADVDGDGDVTTYDGILVYQRVLEVIDKFPAE